MAYLVDGIETCAHARCFLCIVCGEPADYVRHPDTKGLGRDAWCWHHLPSEYLAGRHPMKLIICDKCHDVVGLCYDERRCACGQCGGKYIDAVVVLVDGRCRVIGLDNDIRYGIRARVEAWVITEPHEHIRRGATTHA